MMKRIFAVVLCLLLLAACGAPAQPPVTEEPPAPVTPSAPTEEPNGTEEPVTPPAAEPPVEEPPAEVPPVEETPAQQPPAQTPPAVTPPAAPAKPKEFPPKKEPSLPDEEDKHAKRLSAIDFDALLQLNGDTKGWIYQPGTGIDYPILQSKDNEYYLNRTFEKKWNTTVGAIYLDYRNDASMDDFNTIIYGHDLKAGTMFSSLNNYIDDPALYHENNPSIYVATADGRIFRYDVFAACEAPVPGAHWRLGLEDFDGRQAYIEYCLYYDTNLTDIIPSPADHILTLSTCTGRGHHSRCVVQLVRAKEF